MAGSNYSPIKELLQGKRQKLGGLLTHMSMASLKTYFNKMLLTGFKIKGLTGLYGVHFATIAKLHGTLYHISKLLTLLRQIYFRTATRMKSEPDRLHGAGLCVWNDPFHLAVFSSSIFSK